ncbi:MAG: hypothetical protein U5R49_11605 [Deltaproteobacteria bacterium]|nr:hypothetical protein [Deltaproteobacteria bacterium]
MTYRTYGPLRYDPYKVFRKSKTPVGLYARQKWLNEADAPVWQRDFDEQTTGLFEGQSADGSWGRSVRETVRRLFGLHLTVRHPDPQIDTALEWLVGKILQTSGQRHAKGKGPLKPQEVVGLPFTTGSRASFEIAAALFLASIFQKAQDPRVMNGYACLGERMFKKGERSCGWASFSNYLRALVVHPQYHKRRITRRAVLVLAGVQSPDGRWPKRLPFYQNINALAHLDFKEARDQLIPAFDTLVNTQSRDGTWGRADREWNTFLVVHALRNKGIF